MTALMREMLATLKTLKDALYHYFAVKNWGVRREYGPYKDAHPHENPWRLRWMLFRLNVHYRILRRKDYLYDRIPYLQGAESASIERPTALSFATGLLTYDVISFDVFDTLILRPFANPTDLFLLVGKQLENDFFCRIRLECEAEARQATFAEKGSREVTLGDIYALMEARSGIPKGKGMQAELDAELQYCFANPYMLRVFQLMIEQGKTVLAASDTCLSQDEMKKLLNRCGYTGFEKLYVSCDCGASKRDGSLYSRMKNDYPGKKIVHIGDDLSSDIAMARQNGLDTRHCVNCHDTGNRYRADGMSALIGSAYSGIVNTHLHNGIRTYSAEYEYGFIFGGLYVLGFCCWLHRKAKEEGLEKLLFRAADGGIYQRVFNLIFNDIPNENLLWPESGSRIADSAEGQQLRGYLAARIADAKKVAVVDIGWRNSGVLEPKQLAEEMGVGCALFCALPVMTATVDDGMVAAYLSPDTESRKSMDNHALSDHGQNHAYFEQFSRDAAPAFLGFSEDGKFRFDTPTVEDYETIRQIHEGIYDFCRLYWNTFWKEPCMLDIDGRDAYMPFRMAVRNPSYVRRLFPNCIV